MRFPVRTQDKARFIKRIMSTKNLGNGNHAVLKHLLGNESLMSKLCFTHCVDKQEDGVGIRLTAACSGGIELEFYVSGYFYTTDPYQAIDYYYEDVTVIFLEIVYEGYLADQTYQELLGMLNERPLKRGNSKEFSAVDRVLECILYRDRLEKLDQKIDRALAERDKPAFMRFTTERNELMEAMPVDFIKNTNEKP